MIQQVPGYRAVVASAAAATTTTTTAAATTTTTTTTAAATATATAAAATATAGPKLIQDVVYVILQLPEFIQDLGRDAMMVGFMGERWRGEKQGEEGNDQEGKETAT